jgi:hypothetical protein
MSKHNLDHYLVIGWLALSAAILATSVYALFHVATRFG